MARSAANHQPLATSYQPLPARKDLIRILSIDGGGIRGIIPAVLLAEIERRTRCPIARLFDLAAGTSTGGILALGLTIPKSSSAPLYAAEQLIDLYAREGARIFARSLWRRLSSCGNLRREKYPSRGIDQVLWNYFGESRLRDAVTDVLITGYEIEHSFPFFFRSSLARERTDYDFPARDVARSTSAAPTYFQPMKLLTGTYPDHYTLIDGGVFANNPAACALVEARTTFPDATDFLVVSLGTGELAHSLPYDTTKNWGALQWAIPVLDLVFDGVSRTVDYQMRQLLPSASGNCRRYYRFQATLDSHNHSLDNASPENITALKGLANDLVKEESAALDQLCDKLLE